MLYYQNMMTGKVTARHPGDEPQGNDWEEITEEEYEMLLHPFQTEEEQLTEIYAHYQKKD